jgi:hypothetical protein
VHTRTHTHMFCHIRLRRVSEAKYTWPGSSWRPSARDAGVIATRPQVLRSMHSVCLAQMLCCVGALARLCVYVCVCVCACVFATVGAILIWPR